MEREEYSVPPLRTEELKRLSIFEVHEILDSSLWTNEKIRATVQSTSQNLEELKYFLQIILKVLQNKTFRRSKSYKPGPCFGIF